MIPQMAGKIGDAVAKLEQLLVCRLPLKVNREHFKNAEGIVQEESKADGGEASTEDVTEAKEVVVKAKKVIRKDA
jgi:hypothetical protein